MSTIKVNTIESPNGRPITIGSSATATEISISKNTIDIVADVDTLGDFPDEGSTQIRAKQGVVCSNYAICTPAPTLGEHLCNKTYVDGKIVINPGVVFSVTHNSGVMSKTSTTKAMPYTMRLTQGAQLCHLYLGNIKTSLAGVRITAQFCSGSGVLDTWLAIPASATLLGSEIDVCGVNELVGSGGGATHMIRMPYVLAAPLTGATPTGIVWRAYTTATDYSVEISETQSIKLPKN